MLITEAIAVAGIGVLIGLTVYLDKRNLPQFGSLSFIFLIVYTIGVIGFLNR